MNSETETILRDIPTNDLIEELVVRRNVPDLHGKIARARIAERDQRLIWGQRQDAWRKARASERLKK